MLVDKQNCFARKIALLILWIQGTGRRVTFGEAFRPQLTAE